MKFDYNFYVTNPADIDIQRVLAESPNDKHVILIHPNNPLLHVSPGLLILKPAFLKLFPPIKALLLGHHLGANWGHPVEGFVACGIDTRAYHYNVPSDMVLSGDRATLVNSYDIRTLPDQLALCRKFLADRQEVRVIYL